MVLVPSRTFARAALDASSLEPGAVERRVLVFVRPRLRVGLDSEISMRLASLLAEGTFHASLARAGLNLKEAISHGATLVLPEDSTFDLRDEILGAAATLERVHSRARRVFGDSHPFTVHVLDSLGKTRTMVCSIDNSTITYIE